MNELRYTLVCDGSSDAALLPILTWLLRQHALDHVIQPNWADLRGLPRPPHSLHERIRWACELYPCDIIFIHRDAEREPRERRTAEIWAAWDALQPATGLPSPICVVPVRMTEAWLLFDEAAIRRAAGNRSGRATLDLPVLRDVESLPDPKDTLYGLLRTASELHGRRLKDFRPSHAAVRVSELIDDFEPLRQLSAFCALEKDVQTLLDARLH